MVDARSGPVEEVHRLPFPVRLAPTDRDPDLPRDAAANAGSPRSRAPLYVGIALIVLAISAAIYLSTLAWTGPHRSPIALAILSVQISRGAVPYVIYVLAAGSVAFLLARAPSRRRMIAGIAALAGGACLGGGVLIFLAITNVLGVALSLASSVWIVAGFAGISLGVVSLWSARGWRTIGTSFAIVLVILAGTLGINADFGLDPTVGALAGVSTLSTVSVPVVTATPKPIPSALAGGALWANWVPPADLPSLGRTNQVDIPGLISGFRARPAGIYFPPAALVKNPPALPLVIMMMGQPGNPDPAFQQQVLDPIQQRNHGLAPIVLVADQVGNPAVDPLCVNSARYGNAETYITQDVVNWARTHLHILEDPAHWTIAGYSNGGECALAFGAKYPTIWQNVLDISGEQYPGADESAAALATVFKGDRAAYQATWPVNILRAGHYPDTVGIFTVGSNDYTYRKEALTVSGAATSAGWKTTYFEVPRGGHVLKALLGGLGEGYSVLYPRLGLSQPTSAPTPTAGAPGG